MSNPFSVFDINPLMSGEELNRELTERLKYVNGLYTLYAHYFNRIKGSYLSTVKGQNVETLMSKRYVAGLDLDKDILDEKELEEFLKSLNILDENGYDLEGEATEVAPPRRDKRSEVYSLSSFEARDQKKTIESARQAYRANSQNIAPMMDALVELRFKEKLVQMADALAKELSARGIVCDENEFRDILTTMEPYQKLRAAYTEISTEEGRRKYVPETYIKDQMSRDDMLRVVSPERVEFLLSREEEYARKHRAEQAFVGGDKSIAEEYQIAENQDHDHAWGIVLQEPQYVFYDQPVNTPIFQGRVTLERLGYILEKSLFKKREKVQEKMVEVRQRANMKQNRLLGRYRMAAGDSPRTVMVPMREYSYRNEACKTLADHVFRVTKFDKYGVGSTRIIFSPLEYNGSEEPEYLEFIKNVYLSDPMLEIAAKNGGYAGRIERDKDGYFISTRYSEDEISAAVLFANGVGGTIVDKRDRKLSLKYTDATNETLNKLLAEPERERDFYE